MYHNIGEKIKGLASAILYIGALFACVITVIIAGFMYKMGSGMGIWIGILVGAIIFLLSWLSTWILYAFGVITEESEAQTEQLRQQTALLKKLMEGQADHSSSNPDEQTNYADAESEKPAEESGQAPAWESEPEPSETKQASTIGSWRNEAAGSWTQEDRTVHFATRKAGTLKCPVCGQLQWPDRDQCYNCTIKFVFDDEIQ